MFRSEEHIPAASRILPFKGRARSGSLDPCARFFSCLPGAPWVPPRLRFISCHQLVMPSHLQEHSKQVASLGVEREPAAGGHSSSALFGGALPLSALHA